MALPIRTDHLSRRALTLVHSRAENAEDAAPASRSAGSEGQRVESDHAVQHDGQAVTASPASLSQQSGGQTAPLSSRAQLSDSELVALCSAGETWAFESLYRRHASYALSLAVRVQGHGLDTEDIVHDAFLKVHARLKDLRSGASFKAWLSSIVVSLVRTRLRRRRLMSNLGLSAGEPIDLDAVVSRDAGPEVRAQLAQVYATLAGVPVDQRICWVLRYLGGYKLEEVAELAHCSLATAKRRIAEVQSQLVPVTQSAEGRLDQATEDSSDAETVDQPKGAR